MSTRAHLVWDYGVGFIKYRELKLATKSPPIKGAILSNYKTYITIDIFPSSLPVVFPSY